MSTIVSGLRKLCYCIVLVCSFNLVLAQQQGTSLQPGFEIIDGADHAASHISALNQADLESLRLRDEDRILAFEDGVSFKLHAADVLALSDPQIDPSEYTEKAKLDPAISHLLKLGSNGQIAIRSIVDPNSKLAKIGSGFPRPSRIYISPELFEQASPEKRQMILDNPETYRLE